MSEIFANHFRAVSPDLIEYLVNGKRALRRQIAVCEALYESTSNVYQEIHTIVRDQGLDYGAISNSPLNPWWKKQEKAFLESEAHLEYLKATLKETINRAKHFKKQYKTAIEKAKRTSKNQEKRLKVAAAENGISVSSMLSGNTNTTGLQRLIREIKNESKSDLNHLERLDKERYELGIRLGKIIMESSRRMSDIWKSLAPNDLMYNDIDAGLIQLQWAQKNGNSGYAFVEQQKKSLEKLGESTMNLGKRAVKTTVSASRKTSHAVKKKIDKHRNGSSDNLHSVNNEDLNQQSIDELFGDINDNPTYNAPPKTKSSKRRSTKANTIHQPANNELSHGSGIGVYPEPTKQPSPQFTRPLFAEFDIEEESLGSFSPGEYMVNREEDFYDQDDIENLLMKAKQALGQTP